MVNLPNSIYEYRYEHSKALAVGTCNECQEDIYQGETLLYLWNL